MYKYVYACVYKCTDIYKYIYIYMNVYINRYIYNYMYEKQSRPGFVTLLVVETFECVLHDDTALTLHYGPDQIQVTRAPMEELCLFNR